jgi:hypothetical protein
MRTKVCFKCDAELPITNFYKHPMMGDGHLGKCKACARYDVRENRKRRLTYYVEYDRLRSKNPERRSAIRSYQHPFKDAARKSLHKAVAAGEVKKSPCEVCGEVKSEAHHTDYNKPLDVMWVCRKHHADIHRMSPEE